MSEDSNCPTNQPPKSNSHDSSVGDLRKNNVANLLDDGWNGKNTVTSTLKMKSAKPGHYMKVNTVTALSTTDDELSLKSCPDLEVRLKWWGSDLKAKVKGGRFTEQVDLGTKQWKYNWNGKERSVWLNPYSSWSGTLTWENWVYSSGAIVTWCKDFTSRLQLNHDQRDQSDSSSAWTFNSSHRYSRGNFWADWVYNTNLMNPFSVLNRTLRLGWNERNLHLLAQLEKNASNEGNPLADSVAVGGSWSADGWGLAARVKAFTDDRNVQMEGAASKKVNNNWSVKGKVDNNLNWNLMSNWRMCSGLSSEWAVAGNLNDGVKGGLYGAPLKFGMKLKMDK